MKFAILAAGEGSRLQHEGIYEPKPLIHIGGEIMIDRLIRIFNMLEPEEIVIICNTLHPETAVHIKNVTMRQSNAPIRLIERNTKSSMHSMHAIAPFLSEGPFCLTTVDTIFKADEFIDYIRKFQISNVDAMMAVTNYIDDEKPLYVHTDDKLRITSFDDERKNNTRYISGGIYAMQPQCIETLNRCIAEGKSRMRNFQRALLTDHLQVEAVVFNKILDIDHASDIPKAEEFLSFKE